jgi:enamine deaminase RidA (YjgF/YER057c/UK114 family)
MPGPQMLAACVSDGLVFVAGLDACDGEGLAASARVHPTAPYFHDPARAQMRVILDRAGTILKAAGSDWQHVVRVIQFHSDLAGLSGACAAQRFTGICYGGAAIAVQASTKSFSPGMSITSDIWATHKPIGRHVIGILGYCCYPLQNDADRPICATEFRLYLAQANFD